MEQFWTGRWCAALGAGLMAAAMIGGPAHAVAATPMGKGAAMADAELALGGHCAVCVVKAQKWVKGSPEHTSVYDGHRYQFPSAAEQRVFDADPAAFTPALGGDCVVCLKNMGKRVAGSVKHTAKYKGRLYLFPGEEPKQEFLRAPQTYADVDLAHNGDCAVCLAKAQKHVAGKPEFAAYYKGLRYLFPSDKERQAFCAAPEEFEDKQMASSQPAPAAELVSITGSSACAGCSYGVRPVDAPGELGLAVKTTDGRVFVIEDAHRSYPEVYAKRFDGITLRVQGVAFQTRENVSWLRPVDLRVVN